MSPRQWLAELHRRDPVLAAVGWLHFGLLAALVLIAPFDTRVITGLNPWIKPMKFAVSIGMYLWTVGWLMAHVPAARAAKAFVRWAIAVAMTVEMVCITLQAARGLTSHYNVSTPFDALVFTTMGNLIAVNTLAAMGLLVLFLRRLPLSPAYVCGIRLGTVLFIVGSLEALVMIHQGAHTVGAPDGGPGLPLVNWSSVAGDLRAAHLVGLHALQVLPLAGFALSRWKPGLTAGAQVGWVAALAALYCAAGLGLFRLAMLGRPLFAVQ